MTDTEISELDAFLNQWTDSPNQAKNAFLELLAHLKKKIRSILSSFPGKV